MALDLIDIGRMAVTEESDHWLKVEAAMTGESKQQIIRDLLHEHAVRQLEKIDKAARLKAAHSPNNGRNTDSPRKGDGES